MDYVYQDGKAVESVRIPGYAGASGLDDNQAMLRLMKEEQDREKNGENTQDIEMVCYCIRWQLRTHVQHHSKRACCVMSLQCSHVVSAWFLVLNAIMSREERYLSCCSVLLASGTHLR